MLQLHIVLVKESNYGNHGKAGKGRQGAVKGRSQFMEGLWRKRNTTNGRIVDVKTSGRKFKGVRREK